MTGDFFFEKITFGEILRVLEHSFSVKFHLKNESIKDVFLTAQSVSYTHLDVYKRQVLVNQAFRKQEN